MIKFLNNLNPRNITICIFIGLVLISNINSTPSEACKTNEECMELNYCELSKNKCVHKKIFSDIQKELIGLISIIFGSALSNAGGIGGGGLLIPILLLILKFYTHEAIPISKLMIFTGAITSFILGFRQKHPTRNSITIEYNIPLLLVPMLLFGTMVGVTLNKVTPPWLILVSLTAVLIINTYKTLKKAKNLYSSENKRKLSADENSIRVLSQYDDSKRSDLADRKNEKKNLVLNELSVNESDLQEKGKNQNNLEYSKCNVGTTFDNPGNLSFQELLKIEEQLDLRRFPLDKMVFMIICYSVMLLINFLKGSDYMKSIIGVQICTPEYWLIYFIYFPFALLITYLVARKIKKEYDYRVSIGYPYNNTDIKWNQNIFIKFPIYSFVSGLMAGLLGIGGGLILGPLLLELGLHPMISTATSNFLVLFTSSSTSIQFIILGMMNFDFGIACTIASTVGSFVGTLLIQKLLEKTGRNSYIIFALGGVLAISTILIPIHTLMQIIDQVSEGKSIWSFNKPC